MESICWYITESLRKIILYATITDGNIQKKYFHRHISNDNFFSVYFLFVKPSVFLLTKLAINIKIIEKWYINRIFFFMN
jgi:hypothetical protein